jgi:hypothetical protein
MADIRVADREDKRPERQARRAKRAGFNFR